MRVANVQDGFLNLSEIKEIEVSEELIDRYSLKNGDVLFTEGGDYDKLGRGTVWQGQIKNCLHQNHVFVVRPQADVLSPYFLSYQAGSRYGKQYFLKCSKQTTNLASINSTQLKGFPVLMPTIEEQAQIVLLIDDLLAKEQQAKEAAEGVLDQIDLIKKSVLARAFRGELGTNDPSEESVIKLLERSFSETIESEKVSHKQVSKQKAEVVFVPKTIMEALSTGVRLTPENLKRETELPIDDFYARLKELIDNGSVVESRENGESYLEAANENRQTENQ